MEMLNTLDGGFTRYRMRKKYHRVDGKKNTKVIRFGGSPKRSWRFRISPKLRLKIVSPIRLWTKFKNAYVNMMLNLAGNKGLLSNENVFGGKRVPKGREVVTKYSNTEFENRLIYEMYKSLVVSMELYNR